MPIPVGYTQTHNGFFYRQDGTGPFVIDAAGTPYLAAGIAMGVDPGGIATGISFAPIWNNVAVTYNGILVNATDTASAANSTLLDLQIGGASKFTVGKGAGAYFSANLFEQRNGTSPQAQRLYNTYTDPANYEVGVFDWTISAGALTIGTLQAGTGVARQIRFMIGGTGRWNMTGGSFAPVTPGGSTLGSNAGGLLGLYIDYTNTATIGAVVINKAAGRVNIAAGATSVVVTNNRATAASEIFAVAAQVDANNPVLLSVVPAAGSFTINVAPAPAANQAWSFVIINTD